MVEFKKIGEIQNYYGGLFVFCKEGKHYMMMEDYVNTPDEGGDFSEIDICGQNVEEISKELYIALVSH